MWLVVTLVPLPSEVLVTCRPMSKHWAWFPSEVHTNTGRLCSAGSGCHPVPRRPRSSAALRLPRPLGPWLRFPWPVAALDADACSLPRGPTTRVPAYGSCVGDGSPALRKTGFFFEERRGPPRFLGRPLRACHGRPPRRIRASPRPPDGEAVIAFRSFSTLGIREG